MLIATNSEKIDISLEDKTSELAKSFSRTLQKGDVAYFHGEIGVGKTTFIRHLINNLQQLNKINLTEVTSPTFNLVNEYDVGNFIIQHYDLYRLTDYSEIKNIGLFENREEVVTLIEWPEKIKETIDSKIDLHFEYNDDLSKRYLTIKGVKNK
ncbi:bifunctional tRNA (adenosine(37)-N6)-threonylcarbamoyltransferase complex ATPase subunit type 1 TsaE/phosphotransferase [Candidatus Pelagibacter ubique]|jgi:tRNA threonylcarbamoyl adenosine modification protein YjeE|uniref:tRNA threonylcarbamoyladenosine biosynthesis protein TsaE n=1 Tax=Pelagibacter ubique (strain HTCC1002) TaxID=314261 RepID=Q1V0V1_PELU1|nr:MULTISPECIES: bifunctional tRNA (adenosine(37)-N6)-threonylcarbamoyltransferase complex ATPase subunit type 1 TsaE/phosphotransferase [Pelagibacter]EAS85127.1 possible cell division control protein 6 [Candidatus Pelagibacter ubique HTCC1002]MDA7444713.1 bifunctional tRNA (adenosine(37)-N6)-threonylcarbamoyltransferase complex ATPase subunit type 1 TsaE/phosphotransferase [Candidatus Pelagibacter ubique]MDA7452379.1 bifunctional tRNA (adenosine(37)-N6)-threonylcarbamoyltransferase complex ATPa